MAITYQGGSKRPAKKNRTGLIAGCCVAVLGVVLLVALGIWTYTHSGLKSEKYKSPEEVAQAFIEKFYAGDAAGIFSMQPENMQARSKQDTEMTYSSGEVDLDTVIESQRKSMDAHLDNIHSAYGDNWTVSLSSVGSYTQYPADEIESLQMSYRMMGVDDDFKLDDAGYVTVTVTFSGDSGVGPTDSVVNVPVIKMDGHWYIGQTYGEVYGNLEEGSISDIAGDLLDGYHIVGEFDADGERIYRTADGSQILTDDKGKHYYEDEYGNKHYCEYKVLDVYGQVEITKETKVTGPDGGEVLTEDTYEDYWSAYYDAMAAEYEYDEEFIDEHEHIDEEPSVSENAVVDE